MAVKVIIPTPLRQYADKRDAVELEAKTVEEALAGLVAAHADLRQHLFTPEGRLRSFVNVYLNDEDIRFLEKEQTPVRDNDVLSIVPSIAGGADGQLLAPAMPRQGAHPGKPKGKKRTR